MHQRLQDKQARSANWRRQMRTGIYIDGQAPLAVIEGSTGQVGARDGVGENRGAGIGKAGLQHPWQSEPEENVEDVGAEGV